MEFSSFRHIQSFHAEGMRSKSALKIHFYK